MQKQLSDEGFSSLCDWTVGMIGGLGWICLARSHGAKSGWWAEFGLILG
jgi:hypothetical protein